MATRTKAVEEEVVTMPMSTDRRQANSIYNDAAKKMQKYLQKGKSVVFWCEGYPLFFDSFNYLLQRSKW